MNKKHMFAIVFIFGFLTQNLLACPTCIGRLQINDPLFFMDKHYPPENELYDAGSDTQNQDDSSEQNTNQAKPE